ncbi:MAG: histidinol-phosphate transaminase [bacterium]
MNNNLPPRHDIPSFWRPHTLDTIFLHLGENPFSPTGRVQQAIAEAARHANRYPDTNGLALRVRLAEYVDHGLRPENILLGNGSDELIDLAVVAFADPSRPVATFEPSFFVYAFAAQRHGIPVLTLERAGDCALPPCASALSMVKNEAVSLTFIANPNNPTGTLTPRGRLVEYLDQWPGIVTVDECYFEFCGETVVDLIPQHENLLIIRSLSKSFGLSGLRLGYAVGQEKTVDILARHAMTFPVNALAQAAGLAALEEVEIHRERIRGLIQARAILRRDLEALGLEVLPSHANFLLTLWPETPPDRHPARLLAERGILVSDQSAALNLGRPALRLALGTPDENRRLLEAVRDLLG